MILDELFYDRFKSPPFALWQERAYKRSSYRARRVCWLKWLACNRLIRCGKTLAQTLGIF
jgi:hypothetical protein